MFGKYYIVCNTAAGRRRYMQYLIPQVLSSNIVDRYDIWLNTINPHDIAFFDLLSKRNSKINIIKQPEGVVDGNKSINAFYKYCCSPNTIYIKLDDDILWIEPDFFPKIIQFRIDNPNYFLISPLVINNPKCTYLLQVSGAIKLKKYIDANNSNEIFWKKGQFAKELHEWFINKYLINDRYPQLHIGMYPISLTRFSINCIVWFGEQFRDFDGIVLGDDEEYLSCILPTKLGLNNCFFCNTIISHFSFYTQRAILDNCNILERYGSLVEKMMAQNSEYHDIFEIVQFCKRESENIEVDLSYYPSHKMEKIKIKNSIHRYMSDLFWKKAPMSLKVMEHALREYRDQDIYNNYIL